MIGGEMGLVLYLHLRHGVQRRQRGGQHVAVLQVEEAEVLLTSEFEHLGDWRRRGY